MSHKNILLVLGASSDIGRQFIREYDGEALILAHYNRSKDGLAELKNIKNNKVILIQADLSSEQDTNKMIAEIEAKHGVPNLIVQLAAPKYRNVRFKDVVWNDFQEQMNVEVRSFVQVLSRFLPKLTQGKVVCMLSSVTLGVPPKALSQYVTTKYALMGLMKSLASEYAAKKININCISPSMVETKFLSEINEKIVEMSAEANPMKRNARVEDVVPAINFLLSHHSDYMNGANIPVTGGSVF